MNVLKSCCQVRWKKKKSHFSVALLRRRRHRPWNSAYLTAVKYAFTVSVIREKKIIMATRSKTFGFRTLGPFYVTSQMFGLLLAREIDNKVYCSRTGELQFFFFFFFDRNSRHLCFPLRNIVGGTAVLLGCDDMKTYRLLGISNCATFG